ncbi:hypothetical protein C8Q74DRAFT_1222043 [Fomes fomentarius]|nr:hypothetical protein C8Q74DRAFT_1222043 [Fomes fomentarius]
MAHGERGRSPADAQTRGSFTVSRLRRSRLRAPAAPPASMTNSQIDSALQQDVHGARMTTTHAWRQVPHGRCRACFRGGVMLVLLGMDVVSLHPVSAFLAGNLGTAQGFLGQVPGAPNTSLTSVYLDTPLRAMAVDHDSSLWLVSFQGSAATEQARVSRKVPEPCDQKSLQKRMGPSAWARRRRAPFDVLYDQFNGSPAFAVRAHALAVVPTSSSWTLVDGGVPRIAHRHAGMESSCGEIRAAPRRKGLGRSTSAVLGPTASFSHRTEVSMDECTLAVSVQLSPVAIARAECARGGEVSHLWRKLITIGPCKRSEYPPHFRIVATSMRVVVAVPLCLVRPRVRDSERRRPAFDCTSFIGRERGQRTYVRQKRSSPEGVLRTADRPNGTLSVGFRLAQGSKEVVDPNSPRWHRNERLDPTSMLSGDPAQAIATVATPPPTLSTRRSRHESLALDRREAIPNVRVVIHACMPEARSFQDKAYATATKRTWMETQAQYDPYKYIPTGPSV